MQFDDPQDLPTAYLILRHLYDGEVIEWPIAPDHPLHRVFESLEAQGFVARWDRMWPLHDRYRLTDRGIATIESVYRPADADAIYHDVRRRRLDPAQRRAYLAQHGHDPVLWPLLHDPATRWDRWRYDRGSYYDWFWDDEPRYSGGADDRGSSESPSPGRVVAAVPYVVDLDREAGSSGPGLAAARSGHDRDVS